MPTIDYLTLGPEQLTGDVYMIGDVHGSAEAFEAALDCLLPNDVLIVAGDLIDRGENRDNVPTTTQVLDRIIANNLPGAHGPKIYVIKGNHEVDFLSVLSLMKQLTTERQVNPDVAASEELIAELKHFIRNGGRWLFKSEMSDDPAHSWFRHYSTTGHFDSGTQSEKILRSMVKEGNPLDLLIDNFNAYEAMLSALPYIIKIDSPDNKAIVAHADLPFNDDELDRKMSTEQALTEAEKNHITFARVRQFSNVRTEESTPVYCGHNIIDIPNTSTNPAIPVRKDTNHINLDVGAYFTKGLLLFNHTKGSAEIVGAVDKSIPDHIILEHAKEAIEQHVTAARVSVAAEDHATSQSSLAEAPKPYFTSDVFKESVKSRKRSAGDVTDSDITPPKPFL